MSVEEIYEQSTLLKKKCTWYRQQLTQFERRKLKGELADHKLEILRGDLKKSLTILNDFLNENL